MPKGIPFPPEERLARSKENARLWRLNNKERCRDNRIRWRAANPEKRAAANKRYALKHPEKIKEKWQRHQERFPEKCAERTRRFREKNVEKVKAWISAYFKTTAGRAAKVSNENKRRAQIKGCATKATTQQIKELLLSAASCRYCSSLFSIDLRPTIDHIVPLSKGGAHSMENLTVACRPCNSRKGTKVLFEVRT